MKRPPLTDDQREFREQMASLTPQAQHDKYYRISSEYWDEKSADYKQIKPEHPYLVKQNFYTCLGRDNQEKVDGYVLATQHMINQLDMIVHKNTSLEFMKYELKELIAGRKRMVEFEFANAPKEREKGYKPPPLEMGLFD